MKVRGLQLLLAVAASCGCEFHEPGARTPTPSLPPALASLPEDLGSLQKALGFQHWQGVQGYSRALTHYRQIRFARHSNVFISETGPKPGQAEVIEVILVPFDSTGADITLAAQLFAGVRYKFNEKGSVGVIYRFLFTDRQHWDVDWWTGRDFEVSIDSLRMHAICLEFMGQF